MKLFSCSILSLAALVSSVLAQNIDWTAKDAQTCAVNNWAAIKAAVDPNILQTWQFLPSMVKILMEQSGALKADHTLVDHPTTDQILAIARGFPSGIFSPSGDNIVRNCLDNKPEPTPTEPTSTKSEPTPTEPTPTKPEPTPTEPTSTEPEPTSTQHDTATSAHTDESTHQGTATSTQVESSHHDTTTETSVTTSQEQYTTVTHHTSSAPSSPPYTATTTTTSPHKCHPKNTH
ncbi:hypothetical protein GGI25_003537 [Coemansia spiralis]|uniref:Uncharacterized protein n=2 Tax=Coemansia TaxID=4863 RepID=A0A9W8G1X6_9FUNG|nr:hypothetical protein EDC05_004071 [Coemansia umbellata]KAJ2622086.1 hypothetical protein GGI26_003528 [Coemansia sp. RSA 1358]KAJ2676502.1 hypothetical protein GGI25_003537 [Coemansia spiralis]